MKVQDVTKECLASVGLSVEFSNSEVGSLSNLLWVVSNAIEDGITLAHKMAEAQQLQFKDNEKVPVMIDLNSLKRIEWLLTQLTRKETSGLFESADRDFRVDLDYINGLKPEK